MVEGTFLILSFFELLDLIYTIQITLFFIRSRKLIRDALILLLFFRGESVVMEKA